MIASLTPWQRFLLRRLDYLLNVATPAARERWQSELLAHAISYTLTECGRAGLAQQATARLRRAGRRLATSAEEHA